MQKEKKKFEWNRMYKDKMLELKRFIIISTTVWTVSIVGSLALNFWQHHNHANELAVSHAREALKKDLLVREWNSNHGGVYVPVSKDTPPNPYLEVNEREIKTPSGRLLTLVNPAYMTRQLNEVAAKREMIHGHITSLNPIRPGNTPDTWEKKALISFEKGVRERSEIIQTKGKNVMRLMRPLITEQSCLQCHAKQGYKKGDIRGGYSVSVPVDDILSNKMRENVLVSIGHTAMWIVGMFGLLFIHRRLTKGSRAQLTAEIALDGQLREKEVLLKEIHHRVKNNLAVVSSLMNLQLASIDASPEVVDTFNKSRDRIRSIALIHEKLYSSKDFAHIDLKGYLTGLIAYISQSVGTVERRIDIELNIGNDINIKMDTAIPVGLILNELINNAIKYAFPDNRRGQITIDITHASETGFTLKVSDDGKGISEMNDVFQSKSLGMQLVKMLTEQLDGSLDIDSQTDKGTTFTIRFPGTPRDE